MNYFLKIIHNKFALTATLVSGLILILVLILSSRSPRHPATSSQPDSGTTSQLRSALINLSDEKRHNASQYASLIADRLPIYLEEFPTSVGITTSIHVHQFELDPDELTRLEISGLSYVNKNELDVAKNPNVTAFKESFVKALSLLRESGIDPKQLVFVYSDRDYVQATATYWVEKLGLLK